MTVCITVKVSEGLILAADSAATVQEFPKEPGKTGPGPVLKVYDHARKLSHIKDYPVGTLAWGAYLVGPRSVESLIKEYEYKLPSLAEESEKAKEARMRGEGKDLQPYSYTIKHIAQGLLSHLKKYYDAEFKDNPELLRPAIGILVSGYSSGKYFPEQWLIDLPRAGDLIELRPDVNGKPQFGAHWFGMTDAIVRLHWGRDDALIPLLAERLGVQPQEVHELLSKFQYPVIFDGMPLQDAIDYACYMINVAIGRFRFVVGAPLCGGEIDLAVITPNVFTWVRRKTWTA